MAEQKKHMCKWAKVDKDLDAFKKAVLPPKYACRKCARIARTKKQLCKPIALAD